MSLATEKRKLSSMPFLHEQVICENRELAPLSAVNQRLVELIHISRTSSSNSGRVYKIDLRYFKICSA